MSCPVPTSVHSAAQTSRRASSARTMQNVSLAVAALKVCYDFINRQANVKMCVRTFAAGH